MIQIVSTSEDQTRELGQRIGQLLQPGMIVALNGTLGSGKTRMTQGIGLGLNIVADSIVSPTYTICVPYSGRLELLHIDAYRIKDVTEVDELGLDELIEDGVVLVIEWADKIADFLPPISLRIDFDYEDESSRSIQVSAADKYAPLLDALVGHRK